MHAIKEHTATKLVPQLRFKEFDGLVDNCRLDDVVSFKSGGTPSMDKDTNWDGDIPWISAASMRGKYYSKSERTISEEGLKNGSKLALKGHLLLLVRGSMLYNKVPVGIAERDVAFNQDLKALIPNEKSYNEFLYQWFSAKQNFLLHKVTGTGIGAGKLDTDDLKSLKLNLPSLPEQQKIASFLSVVDEKIQQLTKKKELLEQYKKGVMQQLFSGQFRFKDENGNPYPDWEEKLLDEVANIKRGASPRPISDPKWFDEDSNIGWVRISDVTKSNKYLEKTTQYLTKEGVSKSRLIETGSMIMSICATIGKPIYTKFEVCIHDGFVVFEDLQADKEFLYYYLDKIQLQWYRYGQPGSQVNLNTTIVGNETMPFPCIEEQEKIATYLSCIDTKIESVNNQITQTQTFKKGLLQQMFV